MQDKKCLWVKKPAQNRGVRRKTVIEIPGKSKATKSSQGRAQSWWGASRAWKIRVESRWQRKVARKRKSL